MCFKLLPSGSRCHHVVELVGGDSIGGGGGGGFKSVVAISQGLCSWKTAKNRGNGWEPHL